MQKVTKIRIFDKISGYILQKNIIFVVFSKNRRYESGLKFINLRKREY